MTASLEGLAPGEVCRVLGLNRQALMIAERRAFEKLRALVGGTDDYPLLRESFGPTLERAIAQDLERAAKNRSVYRAQGSRARERARLAAKCTE